MYTIFNPKQLTLVDILYWRAQHEPQREAYTFLLDGEAKKVHMTYAELDQEARRIAALLQNRTAVGDRVLLLYPPGLEYIAALFGCFYASVVAVPAYPPRLNQSLKRIQTILQDAQITVALATAKILSSALRTFASDPLVTSVHWITTDTSDRETGWSYRESRRDPSTLALLQYTSGSTGSPKGVMLTHENLIQNAALIQEMIEFSSLDRGLFWLPPYHDLGLMGGILQQIFAGTDRSMVLMTPATFLQQPLRWLRAISSFQVTASGGPNFAYDLCVKAAREETIKDLDLSCWSVAFSGAEPVRAETLERFAQTFAPCGFRPEAWHPCYGLAESTLFVSASYKRDLPRIGTFEKEALETGYAVETKEGSGRPLVSCGSVRRGQEVAIVDPEHCVRLADDTIGEIWVRGRNVGQGYWGKEEATAETFQAFLRSGDGGPFLRTGDLGFCRNGELYVTGRIKDLIIIRGRNLHPQDIEQVVEACHVELRPGCGAAFSVEGQALGLEESSGEQLVVVQEVGRHCDEMAAQEAIGAIRQAVLSAFEVEVVALVLLRAGTILKTSSGKIQRQTCRRAFLAGELKAVAHWMHPEIQRGNGVVEANDGGQDQKEEKEIVDWLTVHIAERAHIRRDEIDVSAPFVQFGLNSVDAIGLSGGLERWLGRSLSSTLVYDYPSIAALAHYLVGGTGRQEPLRSGPAADQSQEPTSRKKSDAIAVIGLSCRFPRANSPEAFWQMLHDGIDGISEVPATRWDAARFYTSDQATPGKMNTRWGGFLQNIKLFDSAFFALSPREAEVMDPQQRLLLEVAWETFEQAGLVPEKLAGSQTGVFIGITSSDYYALHQTHLDYHHAYTNTGSAHSIAANRLSYFFDFRGPSLAIDTACSSSLVAVHQACQSLRLGECDLALAGGVNVLLKPETTIASSQARTMSSNGRCKTFDEAADGYVRSEGCGLVLLKSLEAAEHDGDPILAIIRGSAVNQDGRSNGLTAPNGPSQEAVIRRALQQAEVSPEAISYVETHGSSTPLGDPIEVESLKAVLMPDRRPDQSCLLGAVKTNIGHLEAAAGIAGLIKAVLCLQKGMIPPNLHFHRLNPHISFKGTTFEIPTKPTPWPGSPHAPRIAGVSAFGFGGTNVHVILEGPLVEPLQEETITSSGGDSTSSLSERPVHLLTLSGRSDQALSDLVQRYQDFLAAHTKGGDRPLFLQDFCSSANTGRTHFAHRLAVYAENTEEIREHLAAFVADQPREEMQIGHVEGGRRKVAFLFPGQGCQSVNMARQLYETEPTFRAALDECDRLLYPLLPQDRPKAQSLLSVLYPGSEGTSPIDETVYTQPTLFALEYALAQMWLSWGIKPDVVLGHSMGEYVAACVAGLFSLEDGLKLITARGRLMQSLPEHGIMAVIWAAPERIQPFLEPYEQYVSIAALNGPRNTVISGREEIVRLIVQRLEAENVAEGMSSTESPILTISQASHCPLVDPMLDAFEQIVHEVTFLPLRLPLVCNLTGQILEAGETLEAGYWRRHTREPVQFVTSMQTLATYGCELFLELGPTPVLSKIGKRCLPTHKATWLSSLHQSSDDWHILMQSLAKLYTSGCNPNWSGLDSAWAHQRRRNHLLTLPTYPFEREYCWFKSKEKDQEIGSDRVPTNLWIETNPLPTAQPSIPLPCAQDEISQELPTATEHEANHNQRKDKTNGTNVLQALRQAHEEEHRSILITYVKEQIASLLDIPVQRLDAEQPLQTLGFDSLMAFELQNNMELDLQVHLPMVTLLQRPNIPQLVDQLLTFEELREGIGGAHLVPTSPVQRSDEKSGSAEIAPAALPLSHNQKTLWFHSRLAPESSAYNVVFAARIQHHLDVVALQQALQVLAKRHPLLTSLYTFQDDEPVQYLQPQQTIPLEEVEASAASLTDLQQRFLDESEHSIDLTQGPVFRLKLYRRADDDFLLGFIIHHIAADLRALELLVEELSLLYGLEKDGLPQPSLEQGWQNADYVRWQNALLQSEAVERHWQYWQNELAGELPMLRLPTDQPRPPIQTYRGASHSFLLSTHLEKSLRVVANEEKVTLFTLVLTAYQVLLHRYSGQNDLLVGTPALSRSRAELKRVIGHLANPVVVRAKIAQNATFRELLHQTERGVLDALEHQDFPFALLVERLRLSRDPSYPPICQTYFAWQRPLLLKKEESAGQEHALSLEPLDYRQLGAPFDLTLTGFEMEGGLAVDLRYNIDLFNAKTISRMAEHFLTVLNALVDDPDQDIQEIPLLSEYEQDMLLVEWNATRTDYPQEVCVHQLVEQQVERTPDAVALAFDGDEQLTYQELNAQANQLAQRLIEEGIRQDGLVGVCMERSLELIIALLAVLKAGGAYVPLDPGYPQERIHFLLEDAQIPVVLTQAHLLDRVALSHVQLICVGAAGKEPWVCPMTKEGRDNPASCVRPDNLAYLIYTSGSTGRPKGVMNIHRGICNRLYWMQQTYQLTSSDCILQKTPFSFDVSVWEFFGPLMTGARLILAEPGGHQDSAYLKALVAEQAVTTLHFVPSMLQAFLGEDDLQSCRSLRQVMCSGETLSAELAARFFAQVGEKVQLHNLYGPTEAAIDVTFWACQHEHVNARVPIGRPIANTQIYLLDKNLQSVPIGVTAELYIGGVALARGYVNRPELTAERFIPNPFAGGAGISEPGARLYRTGDLARYRADGVIEYLGRIDSQVKLRGFRIELGEIEATLRAHPEVDDAVVVLREVREGMHYLVAYVVLRSGSSLQTKLLQGYLREQLPDYMVPTYMIELPELPLTPNGKVDRQALLEVDLGEADQEPGQVAPLTPLQELLGQVWQEVLHLPQIGIHESFFELGGHSLLATQIVSRLHRALGVDLPLRSLFEAPTIAQLALHLEQVMREASPAPLALGQAHPLVPMQRLADLPLSFAQERLWFLHQWETHSSWYNVPIALRLSGSLQIWALEGSLAEVVQQHEALRTTFEEHLGRPVQVIAPTLPIQFPKIDLRGLGPAESDQQVSQLARAQAQSPFDLLVGPLWRTCLLKLDEQEYVLLFTLHHIVTDAWSMEVLVREIATLYQAHVDGEPARLKALPIQYADYALWQRQWLQGEVLEGQLAYWRKQLTDFSGRVPAPSLHLPMDRPRPAVKTDRGASQSCLLPKGVSDELVHLSRKQDVTLFMLLLASFQVLLMRYSGQTDISIGTPIANRTRPEIEGLIGFFVNTLVMRTNLAGNPTFEDLLRRVRETCLAAYVHQDIPFEKVVEELEPERDLSRTPLFQVMLALQNTPGGMGVAQVPDLAGVSVTPLFGEHTTSKFDLTLYVAETEQGLACVLEYSTDLFEAQTITRMLTHFQTLLQGIVQEPQACLFDLPMLTEAEREQVLVEWNATRVPYPQDRCVHHLFEEQVERIPDAVALVIEDEQLTYMNLNQRANHLASYLQELGVGPERSVGICMQRSLEMALSVLAVLKAGGAVVPIDPSLPMQRQAFVCTDAQITVLLTQHELRQHWQEPLAQIVVEVASVSDALGGLAALDQRVSGQSWSIQPGSQVQVENLCYVIYTSGSTGTPKGVGVPHRMLVNLLAWHRSNLLGGVHALQFASLSFDVSFYEMFATWCTGGMLFLATERMRPDVAALARFLEERAIEKVILPVVVLHQLAREYGQQRDWGSQLKEVITTGEQLQINQACVTLFEPREQVALHNHYGPSETHVVTAYPLEGFAGEWPTHPPIGWPIANTDIYLLDQHGQPVPIGVTGELYIGGEGLARGYVNRPEFTAERFLPHPWSQEPGKRLYRTGDLARYQADGAIEYLGRIDRQVKLQGSRIELGEIEMVLLTHPSVQEAVVILREESEQRRHLVAYVVPRLPREEQTGESLPVSTSPAPVQDTVQKYLREQLPDYMVPTQFVVLDALPLTPNGKLDWRALPVPEETRNEKSGMPEGAKAPLEELLVGIFCEVLGRSQVGVFENFFELGGHSLLATQLLSRVRTVVEVEVPLRAVFEEPTIAGLTRRVEHALRQDQSMSIPPLVAKPRPEVIPLSFAQERLWFLHQLEPESTAYLISSAHRLLGQTLHLQGLDQSLLDLIQRHENLRTTFLEREGQPVQMIHPVGDSPLMVIDLQGLLPSHREERSLELAGQEAQYPMYLAKGPLLRGALLRLWRREQILLLTLHHIISDGWSYEVLMRELLQLYRAKVSGQSSPVGQAHRLPSLSVQYADYALWQREWLQGEVLQTQLSYWRKQLADLSPLALPTNHPRPRVQSSRGATQSLQISQEVSKELRRLCRKADVTLFMTLLSAFQVLLARYSGQVDIAVGTPIANRKLAAIEGLIGFFVNTLVMRTDLSSNPTFLEILRRVREVCLQAYVNQDIPFEKVVEGLNPERDLSRSPLFQVMFVLQNTPLGGSMALSQALVGIGDVELVPLITPLAVPLGVASKFDLLLFVTETEQGLDCVLEYSTDLFEEAFIIGMLTNLQTLLEGVVQDPRVRLSDLSLLAEAECEQLLVQWNATQVDYLREMTLHQLFEQQVERTPDSVALVCEEHILTYVELSQKANQLAHHLRGLGIGPEGLVGICMQRSLDMVIALLGVLKAGGAYVPLDPSYPQERLTFLLEDAQVPIVLTQTRLLDLLEPIKQFHQHVAFICLELGSSTTPSQNRDHPACPVQPESLAYLIYTSGSTGKPKGVMIPHRNASIMIQWASHHFSKEDLAGVLASTSICFDLSIFELFVPLSQGGTVVLAENLLHLPTIPAASRVTLVNTVPSVLGEMLRLSPLPASVQTVNLAGEPVPLSLVEQLYQQETIQQVFNLYGPSEDTTYSTVELVEQPAVLPILIGRPIANTQIYLLDRSLWPVPTGVTGELYIGGEGLARGYWQRPDLTAERFVPHPWGGLAGERLYRTGDLARYRPDGTIAFLGRIDSQVKLRGYRIELGEIETTLQAYPGVQEAVVVLQEEGETGKYLAAYVMFQREEQVTQEQLRSYLRNQLPDHMVPAAFLFLESLPLSPNGKVERAALPVPERIAQGEVGYVAPQSELEQCLSSIWQEVLGVRTQVGIYDNFFDRGGHSLLATQLISRVRMVVGVELPLRMIFEEPTIAGLTERVEHALRQSQSMPMPPLVAKPRREVIPLSFAQERLWFLDQLEPGCTAYLIPHAQRLLGDLNSIALEQSLSELLYRHESLRTTFAPHAHQPVQIIHPAGPYTLPVIDLQGLRQEQRVEEVRRLAQEEALSPMSLVRGPLWRAALLRMGGREHALLLTLHHIITDGWSNGVLIRELASLYQANVSGQPSPLKPLPIQYADFVLWQREHLVGEVLVSQMAYWRKQLADLSPLQLPTDYPRPAVQTYRGATQSLWLPSALSEELRALGQQENVTLFMLLLAAFQVLLARLSQKSDIAVGTPIANRTQAELEGVIGFFVNTLVMRTDLSGSPTFVEVLQRVRKVCLGAYANQDIPFGKVVEELHPERDLSRSPLFQVAFALQRAPQGEGELIGVSVKPLVQESTRAKFDLTLSITETALGHAPEELCMEVEYSTDLFEASTITRMLRNFQTLLQGIVQDPQARLSDLPILRDAEREQLLVTWNATKMDYPQDLCLHQLFEQQVEQAPDAIALVFEEQELTYQQINSQANRLAQCLLGEGVGPDVLVGVCMERSPELVVALLAILKAGGAYVPLDPGDPAERLAFMLLDSQVQLVLTRSNLVERLPENGPSQLFLDKDGFLDGLYTYCQNPTCSMTAQSLAYVMYTSGSTGSPKGVCVTHQAVVRLVSHTNYIQLEPTDRIVQAANIAFDAATFELWGAWLEGATLVMLRKEEQLSFPHFAKMLSEQSITTLFLTTALFNQLACEIPHVFQGLRHLLFGGQAVDPHWVRQVLTAGAPQRLLHVYGPTESTTYASWYMVEQVGEHESTVPIGRALANTQLYVLDASMQPVPVGIPGELHIGGDGLARGYWNRAELTAERFVPNPFTGVSDGSEQAGARLYRTGDLVRYRATGDLEYVGRIDRQVKLRGYRIELGEIETALRAHEAIEECVVLAWEDVPGERRLVAYPVVRSGQTITADELRTYLQNRLPLYMIPATFVLLDALPLTPSGKVDHRALASQSLPTGLENRTVVTPRTHVEKSLAAIWQDLLHLEQISITDNFFAIGGHSLLAVQLLNRMNKQFGPWRKAHGLQAISLATLFQAPTIREVAALLQTSVGSLSTSPLVTLQALEQTPWREAKPPLFCVHGGMGDISSFFHLVKHLRHNRPYYGIQAPALGGDEGLFTSVEEMATCYLDELLAVQPSASPTFLLGYSFGGLVAFEMARQLQAQGRSVALLAVVDIHPDPTLEEDSVKQLLEMVEILVRSGKKEALLPYEELRRLQPDEQLAYVLEKLIEAEVVPEDMDLSQLLRYRQVYEMHVSCLKRYRPKPYSGRVTFFRSEDGVADPLLWTPFSSEPIEVHSVPGDHNSMVAEPSVQALAHQLQQCLDKAESE